MASWISLADAIENGRGAERPFNCPWHGDKNASASVNVEKNVFYCYVCQKGGKTPAGKHDVKYLAQMDVDEPIPVLPWAALQMTNMYLGYSRYWASRYDVDVAVRFFTGVDPVTGLPTVPIMSNDGSRLHGFLLRNHDGAQPKYLYPRAVPVSRLLFGAHLALGMQVDTLLLVEGPSDAMALARWQHDGCVGAAVYGAGIKRPQAELVKALQPRRVLVGMDADPAGQQANQRSLDVLAGVGVAADVVSWSDFGVSDPGELEGDPWMKLR